MKKIVYITLAATAILLTVIGISRLGLRSPVAAASQTILAASAIDVFDVAALKVSALQRDGNIVRFLVTNVSGKEVTALTILFNDGNTMTSDYTISGDGISPGASKELSVPNDSTSESRLGFAKVKPFFKIAAVVFTDQTQEGNSQFITEIYDRRRGIKSQLEKFLADLAKMPADTETKMRTGLQNIRQKIQAQPEVDPEESHFFKQGVQDAKDDLLELIKQTEQGQKLQADFQETHARFMEGIGRMRARLSRL